jgi:hypothetical protein
MQMMMMMTEIQSTLNPQGLDGQDLDLKLPPRDQQHFSKLPVISSDGCIGS